MFPLLRLSHFINTRILNLNRTISTSNSKMTTLTLPVTSHPHPLLLYGTAWKKDTTTPLVTTALSTGFVGIDTACQPKHYREDLVGAGLSTYLTSSSATPRPQLFLQTKFTSPAGQDAASIPYDPTAPLETQVTTSVETSLRNLGTPYLDAVLLHSPLPTMGETVAAWKVLESFVSGGSIRHLGVSNISASQLRQLYAHPDVSVKPAIVQNRFYEATGWDREVRDFCREKGMVWQSFWTLTGNPGLLRSTLVGEVAERLNVTREEALYVLVLALGRGWKNGGGVCILDGTKREERMRGDLEVACRVAEVGEGELDKFKNLIGERV
ncbi:NADP-dependent oxidoreductase domain-containing protein [Geopyxis carbonaria]|nr:NADP-dependent oxidoreductase domain-containing protein [Geopyxis carbonaria]